MTNEELKSALQQLAGAVRDNAPDQENDREIAAEYHLLASVHDTIQAVDDYLFDSWADNPFE